MAKRSSSLEYIELIPDSTPPSIDSSVSSTSTTIQRDSQPITDQGRLEEETEVRHIHQDDSEPPQQLDRGSARPPGAAGDSATGAAGGGEGGGEDKEGASSAKSR